MTAIRLEMRDRAIPCPRDLRNLWPEPNTIALADGTSIWSKEKDDLEHELHDKVCS